ARLPHLVRERPRDRPLGADRRLPAAHARPEAAERGAPARAEVSGDRRRRQLQRHQHAQGRARGDPVPPAGERGRRVPAVPRHARVRRAAERLRGRRAPRCDREEVAPILRRAPRLDEENPPMAEAALVREPGSPIRKRKDGTLEVPDNPRIAFVEGDGTGRDIWKASVRVFDAAVAKAYHGRRKVGWHEVLAGEKAFKATKNWLPDQTVDTFRKCLVGIKGPLTTPIGGGIRSLNVALRQILDLYVCLRPVRWYEGVPSPVRNPQLVDMVIFRENTEDIYAGIEWKANSPEAK